MESENISLEQRQLIENITGLTVEELAEAMCIRDKLIQEALWRSKLTPEKAGDSLNKVLSMLNK